MTIFDDNVDNFQQFSTIFDNDKFSQLRQFLMIETIEKTVLETCDICDTDYNYGNWEPEFMTIIVTWQLIVTLDDIRNSYAV